MSIMGWWRNRRQRARSARRLSSAHVTQANSERLRVSIAENRAVAEQAQAAAIRRQSAVEELTETLNQTLERVTRRSLGHASR